MNLIAPVLHTIIRKGRCSEMDIRLKGCAQRQDLVTITAGMRTGIGLGSTGLGILMEHAIIKVLE